MVASYWYARKDYSAMLLFQEPVPGVSAIKRSPDIKTAAQLNGGA